MRLTRRSSLSSAIVLATFPGLAFVGCTGSGATNGNEGTVVSSTVQRDLAPQVSAGDLGTLVTGNSDFAFGLYHGLSGQDTTSNLFYSPYSVSLALAMTYAGAHGETATQLATALSFTLPIATFNAAFDKLDLAIEATPTGASGADGQPFALNLADALWGDQSVTFAPAFVNTLTANYGANLRTVDFVSESAEAESAINSWVANQTNDKIDPLLAPGTLTPLTKFVLVNAVYFNAGWATAFDPSATQAGTFTRADNSTVEAPLMSASSVQGGYFKGENYQAVEIPYSGGTTSMVVVLPNVGAYAAIEKGLSGAFFKSVSASLSPTSGIDLTFPKFTIAGPTVSLVPQLQALGMTDAFDKDKADFSTMIPTGGVFIGDVLHRAFVDVDESGTVAAAATGVIGVGADAVEIPLTVTVNHAFFFFIRDIATNTVLFVGREDDPTAK